MTDYFKSKGRTLIEHGYKIVPIKAGEKRPRLMDWTDLVITPESVSNYSGGVGVLCGTGEFPVVALDIDTLNESLADEFRNWCLDSYGLSCERTGRAPKSLIVYRAESENWHKVTSARFADEITDKHRLEILGKGQQFVAYHIHPDTGKPYEWVDIFGGIEVIAAKDLPVITFDQLEIIISKFEELALKHGLTEVSRGSSVGTTHVYDDDPLMAAQPVGLSLGEAQELLPFIGNEDYDTWLKVGMCLHFEFEGDEAALLLWDSWSNTASNYQDFDDLQYRWSGFRSSGSNSVTGAWLRKVSREARSVLEMAEQREALEKAKELIKGCKDRVILLGEVAPTVAGLAGLAGPGAAPILEGLLRSKFKELTGSVLSITDARRHLTPQTKKQKRRQDTEDGNALRLVDKFGDQLMYVKDADAWYAWTGVYWQRICRVDVERLAKETIRALPTEIALITDDKERMEFFKFCATSQRAMMVKNMLDLAKSDKRLDAKTSDLDSNLNLLGVGNGAIDLKTGKLRAPDPKDKITIITPVHYDPDAVAPLFKQTVSDAFFGEQDLISFFQRLIGYSLLGNPAEHLLAIPYGSGSNGKSTVLNAVLNVLGDHATTAEASTFLSKSKDSSRSAGGNPELLALMGRRFVYINEPDAGDELREAFIKAMTGGDKLSARWLYTNAIINFKPTWVAFLPTNHLPIVKESDGGIWRRLMPIPFERNFEEDLVAKKDTKRAEKLKEEYPGILKWCIDGALAYQKHGLNPPRNVKSARDSYKKDMDLLAEWIEECCELGSGLVDTNAKLWASWEAFARAKGDLKYISSARALGRRLKGRGGLEQIQHSHGISGRGFKGIQVKQVGDF